MSVRVEREIYVPAKREAVWGFIEDPAKRADAISVVEDYEVGPGGSATWHVSLPIPFLSRTIAVETEEVDRDPPRRVEFVGRSNAVEVRGEHELESVDNGTRLTNRFVVDGKLLGVERFFERGLDGELDNLEAALVADLGFEGRP